MTRRGNVEIQHDILSVIANGYKKPTHIMYRTNTSWATMQNHINKLIGKGMIRKLDKVYVITAKGIDVLRELNKIRTPIP